MGLKYLYLAYLSKPVSDRTLYRTIKRQGVTSLMEIGIADPARTLRMLDLATRLAPKATIRYSGIDLFEARKKSHQPLKLKSMHKLLAPTGAKFHLLPGDPLSALSRKANDLPKADLVLVTAGTDQHSLAKAWFFLPRLLEKNSIVLVEKHGEADQIEYDLLDRAEVERLAQRSTGRKAA